MTTTVQLSTTIILLTEMQNSIRYHTFLMEFGIFFIGASILLVQSWYFALTERGEGK